MNDIRKPVQLLEETTARRIAAGEVIDRPHSVLRELMDNAIDSGADDISVYIESGGIKLIRVSDNGSGMSKEDMNLCWLPHATSKISRIEDLDSLSSLGFRGEALSSIGACSRMTITSSDGNDNGGCRLSVHTGKKVGIQETGCARGTSVEAADLFYSIPARRRFLKNPSAEAALCRRIFEEKALPFPQITFRYFVDEKLKIFLPAGDPANRVTGIFSRFLPDKGYSILEKQEDQYSLKILAFPPSVNRKDRKMIQLYVNNRKIDEYAFIQAVQYGYDRYIPGGVFPACFLFLTINPAMVDFNIHPAKREVRFRNLPEIHHTATALLKQYLLENAPRGISIPHLNTPDGELFSQKNHSVKNSEKELKQLYNNLSDNKAAAESFKPYSPTGSFSRQSKQEARPSSVPKSNWDWQIIRNEAAQLQQTPQQTREIRYLGQLMTLFLLFEYDNKLIILDQHAAHEKIIFNLLKQKKPVRQELLIPIEFDADPEEEALLKKNRKAFSRLGFEYAKKEKDNWEITAYPQMAREMESEIAEFLKQTKGSFEELETKLFARISCRSAVKDGEILQESAALELAKGALAMENPRCPHGRPLWFEISRNELFEIMGRTI